MMRPLRFSYSRVSDLSEIQRQYLRTLTFGRDAESPMYRWTFHSEAWAALATVHGVPVGWACVTTQDDYLPVAGVYVTPACRGRGIARALACYLLTTLRGRFPAGAEIQAVSELWSKWPAVIDRAGFRFVEWV